MHALRGFYCHESKTPDGVIFQTLSGVLLYYIKTLKREANFFCCDTGQPITTVTS